MIGRRALIALLSLTISHQAFGEGAVFKIRAAGCTLDPISRASTGFRVDGTDGIITALHGVADCSSIIAQSANPDLSFAMKVAKQDAKRDAALLHPVDQQELQLFNAREQALPRFRALGAADVLAAGDAVIAMGYAGGVLTPQRNSFLKLGRPPKERLGNILGAGNGDIVARGSPAVDQLVIKLEGTVNKGESGGPVYLPARNDVVVGLVLGSPQPGLSTLAWVAPLADLQWSNFDPAIWRTKSVPRSLADAVAFDGPSMQMRLQLSHGRQTKRKIRSFPINFEHSLPAASTATTQNYRADIGTVFESATYEDTELVGLVSRDFVLENGGRTARLNLSFASTASAPRVASRGVVHVTQARNLPPRTHDGEVAFSVGPNALPTGNRILEARTEGDWEQFVLTDDSGVLVAEGAVNARQPSSLAAGSEVAVRVQGNQVTIEFFDPPRRPMPPSTISVQ